MNISKRITYLVFLIASLLTSVVGAAPPEQDGTVVITLENVTQIVELQSFSNRHLIDAPDPHSDTSAVATNFGVWLYDDRGEVFDLLQYIPTILTYNTGWSRDGRHIARGNYLDGLTVTIVYGYPALDTVETFVMLDAEVGFTTFSPDGRQLITSGNFYNHTFQLWDIETGELIRVFEGQSGYVIRAIFVDNGNRIVTAAADQNLRVWDTATGEILATVDLDSEIHDTVLSPDETIAYLGLSRGGIAAVNLIDHQIIWQQTLEWDAENPDAVGPDVNALAVSPDGETLLIGTLRGQLQLRDASTGELLRSISNFPAGIADVAFSPDGGTLYAFQNQFGARGSFVYAFDATSGDMIAEFDLNSASTTPVVPFSHTSPTFFAPQDGHLAEIDSHSGDAVQSFAMIGMPLNATAQALNDDQVLLTSTEQSRSFPSRRFQVVDLDDGEIQFSFETSQPSNLAVLSPDGRWLAVALWDGLVEVWDLTTGETAVIFTEGGLEMMMYTPAVLSLAWSPDSTQLLAYFSGGAVRMWDVQLGTLLDEMELDINTKSVEWWDDGRQVAIYYAGSDAGVWDIETGETIIEFSITTYFRDIAIAHHRQLLAFANHLGEIGFVDLASGEVIHTLQAHSQEGLWSIKWSFDDARLLTVGAEGIQRIWGISGS